MPKPVIIVVAAVVAVVVIGGVVVLSKKDSSGSTTSSQSSNPETKKAAVSDPNGDYKLFSDPSVTKYPEANVKFGNGQTLTFEYDGSKTDNDEYATLSYQLYYVQDNGGVIPMGGGNIEGKGSGAFTLSDKVFNSSAKNRQGFLELEGTYGTGVSESGQITGKNVKLGMYAVEFDIAD